MIYLGTISAAILMNLALEPWRAINDGVMGGVSAGGMSEIDKGLRFDGILSLENNGGFASVRRLVDKDLSNTEGVRITVRGDVRRYQLRLYQQGPFDGVSWSLPFDTENKWQTLELYFADFKPMYRGRPVPSAGYIEPDRITQIGFLIGDNIPGEFHLDINLIGFMNSADTRPRANGNK